MNLLSRSTDAIKGFTKVPGDKSMSHRSIIFGALAKGKTVIQGFLEGEDCKATAAAFQAMGVKIEGPLNEKVVIYGEGKYGLEKPDAPIDCGNSGTSMRLLAGVLCAQPFDSELVGDQSLMNRPMSRVSTPLNLMGAEVSTWDGKPPLRIKGGKTLKGIDYILPQASAQVKSSILLAGLYAEGTTRIKEPQPSRDHTELMLQNFSYPLKKEEGWLEINNKSECSATEIDIPGDISSAAFFIVAATIIPGSSIELINIGINPTRTGIIQLLLKMGADIVVKNKRLYGTEWVADLDVRYAPLKGIEIPSTIIPLAIDEFPILFIAAACAEGKTVLNNAAELRLKESDRIAVMLEGLLNLGIEAQELEDGLIIEGGVMRGGVVDSRGDHRIAMAFAVAGAVSSDSVLIKNTANIATSFPNFTAIANKLHFQIEEVIDNV